MSKKDLDFKFLAIGIAAIMAELSIGKSLFISKYRESGKSWTVEHRKSLINNNRKVGNERWEW